MEERQIEALNTMVRFHVVASFLLRHGKRNAAPTYVVLPA